MDNNKSSLILVMRKMQLFFEELYGPSNSKFTESQIASRIELAVSRLSNADRKIPKEVPGRFCHCVSWSFALANVVGINVATALAKKYAETCGYCGHKPCICPPDRAGFKQAKAVNEKQLAWSPSEWQSHLASLYARANRRAGGDSCFRRLYDEVGEVREIAERLGGIDLHQSTRETLNEKYSGEIADVFGWLFAVADILDLQFEQEVYQHFGNGCPHCKHTPCDCAAISVMADGSWIQADSKEIPYHRSP